MSEPTYRVDLQHHPEQTFPWVATVVRLADDFPMRTTVGSNREDAFDRAQAIVRAMSQPEAPSTVFLSEDGDIIDPHDSQPQAQTKCPRCEGMGTLRVPLYKDPLECGTCGGTGSVAA